MEDKRGGVGGRGNRAPLLNSSAGVQRGLRVRRMGSLITREKGDVHTQAQKTRRNMHGHACAGPDIFSQLHCSLRLAHLHIRGSRTHYQLGEMKGARGGRRTGEEGGDQEEKGRRLMLRRAA